VALAASALCAQAAEPVILDTDCGAFGDDGAALAMLLHSPDRVALRGIVATSGNVWAPQVAEYVFHILALAGKPSIPVYTGAVKPLIHTTEMKAEAERRWGPLEYAGAFSLDAGKVEPAPGARLTGRKARLGAAEFLIREIERAPGQVTILEIAPMTNLALALRLKPEIETKIRRVVFMGGSTDAPGNTTAAAEFNFWFDPEAASAVLRSRIPEKVMFGLDICNLAPLNKAGFDQVAAAATPIARLFREDLGNRYPGFLKNPEARAYLWDALAAAYLLDPGSVTASETRYLDVETRWTERYGAVMPLDRAQAPAATPVRVMLKPDFDRVFALYRKLLTM
jgi:inosine-uridine nucleoside N-ribohydrolase